MRYPKPIAHLKLQKRRQEWENRSFAQIVYLGAVLYDKIFFKLFQLNFCLCKSGYRCDKMKDLKTKVSQK